MRVHLLGLPHTQTTQRFSWCAYTQKIRKLADMLTATGHEVILYASEENEAAVAELVPLVSLAEQAEWYGHYQWDRDVFADFEPDSPGWAAMNSRAIERIRERSEPGDVLGLTMGLAQKSVSDALPELLSVELGIGYQGVFAPYRVFESYAWAHHVAGFYRADDVRFFDAVIPNAIEPELFPLGAGDGGYHLFIGRFIRRKGPHIAVEATQRLGVELVMAGQGVVSGRRGHYEGIEGFTVDGDHVSHVGVVGPEERARLMGGAAAVWTPTIYLEPFGGVAVEAMACGTPVIASDWGAFTETVIEGETGFRCRTLADFVCSGRDVEQLDRARIREYAVSRFSTARVQGEYDAYLAQLATLQGEGWYAVRTSPRSTLTPSTGGR